jgi:hypothetical protein
VAEWFVDASISGGNGTDPASAFPSVGSITWTAGDRAWVRNTHYEFLGSSVYLGTAMGSPSYFSQWHNVIGWPQSDDPWYDIRPARGTTVGWDADVPSTAVYSVWGIKQPTFATSVSANIGIGFLLPVGGSVFNVCLQNNGNIMNMWSSQGDQWQRYLDNVTLLCNSGTFPGGGSVAMRFNASLGKITIPCSTSGTFGTAIIGSSMASMRHLVIPAPGIFPYLLDWSGSNMLHIGHIEVQCASYNLAFGAVTPLISGPNITTDGMFHVGRISGKRPAVGVASTGILGFNGIQIDDYFGDGPMINPSPTQPSTRVASINEAACDIGSGAVRAMIYNVASVVAAAQRYAGVWGNKPVMRGYFDVASGTQLEVRVPLYITGVASLTNGTLMAHLFAAGTKGTVCNSATLLVGTPAAWSGSLITAGSAWIFKSVFHPTETASQVPFEIFPPVFTQATSGLALTGAAYFGQPYKV